MPSTLGEFERQQDLPPNTGRVLDLLEAERDTFPLVVTEIGVACSRRHDQDVVRDLSRVRRYDARRRIDGHDAAKDNDRVPLLAKYAADRHRDIGRREAGGGNLIKQRLK